MDAMMRIKTISKTTAIAVVAPVAKASKVDKIRIMTIFVHIAKGEASKVAPLPVGINPPIGTEMRDVPRLLRGKIKDLDLVVDGNGKIPIVMAVDRSGTEKTKAVSADKAKVRSKTKIVPIAKTGWSVPSDLCHAITVIPKIVAVTVVLQPPDPRDTTTLISNKAFG